MASRWSPRWRPDRHRVRGAGGASRPRGVDIDLPGLDGITAASRLHERLPACRVVVPTVLGRPGQLRAALDAHVAGFMVKDAPSDQLIDVLRKVAAGERFIDQKLALAALEMKESPLSERETDVLRRFAAGGSSTVRLTCWRFPGRRPGARRRLRGGPRGCHGRDARDRRARARHPPGLPGDRRPGGPARRVHRPRHPGGLPAEPRAGRGVVTGQHLGGPAVTRVSKLEALAATSGPVREPVTATYVADGRALIVSVRSRATAATAPRTPRLRRCGIRFCRVRSVERAMQGS